MQCGRTLEKHGGIGLLRSFRSRSLTASGCGSECRYPQELNGFAIPLLTDLMPTPAFIVGAKERAIAI
jgi:hypothetical protein